jgi:hypothetical protein
MYFGSIVYLYAHAPPGSHFCSVTTTLIVNSFGVGTEGGGGGSVVRGVTAVGRDDWEWSLKIMAAATLTSPISIATIASAASNLRMFAINSPVSHVVRGKPRCEEVPDGRC